jgi:RNA polymerase sigma-70 factor (ECF subfamily)
MGVKDIGEYAEKVIRIKARQLVGKAGFTEADREDLAQEMRLDLWRRLPKFDAKKKVKINTFVARVVEHKIASIIEARKAGLRDYRRQRCSLNDPLKTPAGKPAERGDTVDENERWRRTGCPSRSAKDLRDLANDVAAAISNLPPDLRDLCYRLMNQTPTEAAQDAGIPRGTLYESIEMLRRRFEKADLREYL